VCDDEAKWATTITNTTTTSHQQQKDQLNKTCIFCHMFKKYESDLFDEYYCAATNNTNNNNNNNKINITQINDNNEVTTNDERRGVESIKADERMIKLYHSYCKQPNKNNKEKLKWRGSSGSRVVPESRQTPLISANHYSAISLDYDQDLLNKLVNERLNKLFERKKLLGEEAEAEVEAEASLDMKEEFKEERDASLNCKFNKELNDLNDIEIDPGYEISLEDIQKLPDFSYEEYAYFNLFNRFFINFFLMNTLIFIRGFKIIFV
jgi:hypothetical protein